MCTSKCQPGLLQAKARYWKSMEFNLLASLRQRFADISHQRRLCQLEQTQSHSGKLLAPKEESLAAQPTASKGDNHVSAQETVLAKPQVPQDGSTNTPALMTNPQTTPTSQTRLERLHHTQRQHTFKAKSKGAMPRVKFKHPHSPWVCHVDLIASTTWQSASHMHTIRRTTVTDPITPLISHCQSQHASSPASNSQVQAPPQQYINSASVTPPESPTPTAAETRRSVNADNAAGCIRAEPRRTWQSRPGLTGSIHAVVDLGLGRVQGRQTMKPFQVASDLSKVGQLRAPNLHAAVKASRQLMHRFLVRRSAVASLGVFTTGELVTGYTLLVSAWPLAMHLSLVAFVTAVPMDTKVGSISLACTPFLVAYHIPVAARCAGYLAAGELLMEYVGEVIRRPLADNREQQYSSQGLGLYFFALDRDHCIDATHQGNIARYINHSCRYSSAVLPQQLSHFVAQS